MPLFPVFIDLSDRKVLVVGGGEVATRKVKNLLRFTKNVTIVAPEVKKELRDIVKKENLELKKRRFRVSDLKDVDLVVVATSDLSIQRKVFKLCERKRILCNSVDSPEFCSFIFPSLIVRGDLVVGISTGGKVPALSRRIREVIERCIPKDIESILERISEERNRLPKGKRRQRYINELVRKAIPLS